jgi:hypothetical protein
MQKSNPLLKKETWKGRFQSIWIRLSILILIVEIAVPFIVDKLCGHVWGSLAAVLNIIAWLYFGLKSRMASGTMMLWLFALVYVITVAVVEFAYLFHWQITSNGHF